MYIKWFERMKKWMIKDTQSLITIFVEDLTTVNYPDGEIYTEDMLVGHTLDGELVCHINMNKIYNYEQFVDLELFGVENCHAILEHVEGFKTIRCELTDNHIGKHKAVIISPRGIIETYWNYDGKK